MLEEKQIKESIDEHLKRNWEILKFLKERGMELRSALLTEHHFMTKRQLEAGKLAIALDRKGFRILEMTPAETKEGDDGWAIIGEMEMTLEAAADPATSEELIQLAATFDSRYEGWGAELD
ncbi:MAG: ribonuclease E inhibitor RraB [Deltaproteobacteria bacterium]|nr:ribonuclease E inhibitor RraB [Deltaproteobacteria bacterium]